MGSLVSWQSKTIASILDPEGVGDKLNKLNKIYGSFTRQLANT